MDYIAQFRVMHFESNLFKGFSFSELDKILAYSM